MREKEAQRAEERESMGRRIEEELRERVEMAEAEVAIAIGPTTETEKRQMERILR